MHKRAHSESITTNFPRRKGDEATEERKNGRERRDEKERNDIREGKDIKKINATTHPEKKKEEKLESVVVRIRKLEKNEKSTLHTDPNDNRVLYFDKNYEIEKYNFDIVFDENDTNENVFSKIGGPIIINNVCNGFKETILTYGQTGSGKTHTLFGNKQEYGITYFFLSSLCNFHKRFNKKISIYLSIYEIVGDTLVDLIKDCDDKNTNFYMEEYYLKTIKYSYKVISIKSFEMAKRIIDTACLLRNVDATSQNASSSRSHAVIQFFVNTTEKISQNESETTRESFGVLTLVDLVGCEREDFYLNKQGSKTENKHDGKNDRTSSKTLNSSLTSLNKMLRKMQMGTLDESDKRQSVLCKVLYNYIQKTCGVCIIFCFNPKLSQRSLTSSTLIMAYECKKIKSKRKQLIYVKSEDKESFLKNIASNDSSKNGKVKNNQRKEAEEGNAEYSNTAENKRVSISDENSERKKEHDEEQVTSNRCDRNAPIFFIFVNEKGIVQNVLKKGDEDETTNSLRAIVNHILNEQTDEEEKNKNVLKQLENEIVKLKNECKYWKKQTQNYHSKLKILNKNYLKINEFLTNTLNGTPGIKTDTKFAMDNSMNIYGNTYSINNTSDTLESDMSANFQNSITSPSNENSWKCSKEVETDENKKTNYLLEQKHWNTEHAQVELSPKNFKNENILQQKETEPYDQDIYFHRNAQDNNYKKNKRETLEETDKIERTDYLYKENSFHISNEMNEKYFPKENKTDLRKESTIFQEINTENREKQNSHNWNKPQREENGLMNMYQPNYEKISKNRPEHTKSVTPNVDPISNAPNFPSQKMQSICSVRTNTIVGNYNNQNSENGSNNVNRSNERMVEQKVENNNPLKNLISIKDFDKLKKDVTIDSLVSRMQRRIAKTRSLSLAN